MLRRRCDRSGIRRSAADTAGTGIVIGSRNIIREYAQIHQGWKARTTVGDDAFVMNQCYIAHDCTVGDGVTLASSVLLAGHVQVGEGANLGLGTAVHQFREIGRGSMVGMASAVTRDVPPFAKVYGNPASVRGANVVGMQAIGVDAEVIRVLTELYAGEAADVAAIPDGDLRAAVGEWLAGRLAQGDRA